MAQNKLDSMSSPKRPENGRARNGILIFILVILLVLFVAAGVFFWKQLSDNNKTLQNTIDALREDAKENNSLEEDNDTDNTVSNDTVDEDSDDAKEVSSVEISLVVIDDAGKTGKAIGCGDSVVPVTVDVDPTTSPLSKAMETLLALESRDYGSSGLMNALYQSNLEVDEISLADGKATIKLTGSVVLGGTCDGPRVEAQLEETALQFSTVDEVEIFVNNVPLDDILSQK